MRTARRISQVVFFCFFIVLFLLARYPYEHGVNADLFLRFSPLAPFFLFIKDGYIHWAFWPALLILFFTIFFGRFFCGWICPLGTSLDAVSKIVKSPSNKISRRWQSLRFLKFALLVGAVIMAVFSLHLWGYLDPLSIFNRGLSVIFYPLSTWFLEKSLLGLSDVDWIYWIYDQFKLVIMPEAQAFYQQLAWIALFVGVILGLEKLSRRFWCRYLCPAGALLGFLSQFRFYERVVGPECPVCNKCQRECKMNAIPEEDVGHTSKVECIECFNCGAVCPPASQSITYRWRWKPYHTPVDFERRQFLGTSFASLMTLGLFGIGLRNHHQISRQIRPPGSLPEEEFRDRCIRCLECVRICASNGRCLQPSSIQTHLDDLWLPQANMREGYCEYNCNLCGQVCPTDAILPLDLKTKQQTPMGLAHFNKNICIPYDRNEDCIVCEEHCPTPEKAIKFDQRLYTDPQTGEQRLVKYPYVVRELCIGCGICEYKCPLEGEAGIFVTIDHQQRPKSMKNL